MNIWALPKARAIRVALLGLSTRFSIQHLELDCGDASSHQAVVLNDPTRTGLSAYLFTYGQSARHYGLHLQYPGGEDGSTNAEGLEEVTLKRVLELLGMHFELAPAER